MAGLFRAVFRVVRVFTRQPPDPHDLREVLERRLLLVQV